MEDRTPSTVPEIAPSMPVEDSRATLAGLLGLLSWTTAQAVIRDVVGQTGPFLFIGISSGVGGLLLAVAEGARRRDPWAAFRLPAGYLIGGGLTFAAYFCLYPSAQALAPTHAVSVQVGVVNYLWPAFLLLFAVGLFGQRADPRLLAPGIALAFAGAAVCKLESLAAPARLWTDLLDHWPPFALMLLGAICWGLHSNLSRRWSSRAGVNGVPLFNMLVGALGLFLHTLGMGAGAGVDAAGRALVGGLSWQAAPALAYATIFPTALGYLGWEVGMRRGHLGLLAATSYFLPVASTIFACFYLRVPPSPYLFLGAILVMVGAWLSHRALRRTAASTAEAGNESEPKARAPE